MSRPTPMMRTSLALIPAFFAFLLYFNTLNHRYVLDDALVINENLQTQRGIKAIPEIFLTPYREGSISADQTLYRPLSKAMFAIEWNIAPDSPWLGHLINVVFYAATIYFLFHALYLYTGQLLFSFLVVALYTAHPLHTEVVANIKSRDEIMGFFFFVLALIYLHKFIVSEKNTTLLLAGFFYLLSLFSKESAVAYVAIVPAVLYFFLKAGKRHYVLASSVFLGSVLVYFVFRLSVMGIHPSGSQIITTNVLAEAPDILSRYATATYLLGLYIWRMIWPHPLSSDHSFADIQLITSLSDWRFLAALVVLMAMLYRTIRYHRNKELLEFSFVFFFITISVVANMAMLIGTSFAERLVYVPSLGFSIACVALLAKLGARMNCPPLADTALQSFFGLLKAQAFFIFPVLLVCLLYSYKTIVRNADWADNLTLNTADVRNSPNSARAHYYLGTYLSSDDFVNRLTTIDERSKYEALALSELHISLNIYPRLASSLAQLGLIYYRNRNFSQAAQYYERAIQIAPMDGLFRSNYGMVLLKQYKLAAAQEQFTLAIQLNPYIVDAYCNLGAIHGMTGKLDDAIQYYQKAIALNPDYAEAYYSLGLAYEQQGNKDTGAVYKAKAAALDRRKTGK